MMRHGCHRKMSARCFFYFFVVFLRLRQQFVQNGSGNAEETKKRDDMLALFDINVSLKAAVCVSTAFRLRVFAMK